MFTTPTYKMPRTERPPPRRKIPNSPFYEPEQRLVPYAFDEEDDFRLQEREVARKVSANAYNNLPPLLPPDDTYDPFQEQYPPQNGPININNGYTPTNTGRNYSRRYRRTHMWPRRRYHHGARSILKMLPYGSQTRQDIYDQYALRNYRAAMAKAGYNQTAIQAATAPQAYTWRRADYTGTYNNLPVKIPPVHGRGRYRRRRRQTRRRRFRGRGAYTAGITISDLNKPNTAERLQIHGYIKQPYSDHNQQIYHNPTTKHTYFNITGSHNIRDWLINDTALALNNLHNTYRYKSAKNALYKTETLFGKNITLTGHSLGGIIASKIAKPYHTLYTFNKGVSILDKNKPNEYAYRTNMDPVSILNTFAKNTINTKTLPSYFNLKNIFDSHSTRHFNNIKF
jgi:hypothetical protein